MLKSSTQQIIHSIIDSISAFPDYTELSIGIYENELMDYVGLLKENNVIKQIDNKNTSFETGSITKVFTANILVQLFMESGVEFDDLISKYLSFSIKGNPSITLKHLASHTSGLPRLPENFFSYPEYVSDNPYLNYDEKRLITYLTKELELISQPGKEFLYSNLGMGVLSYVLSKTENKPFSQLVEDRIFNKLDMSNSTFDSNELNTRTAKAINNEGGHVGYWDGGILNGCVGIISTAEDMMRFAKNVLDTSNKVSDLQMREMATVRPGVMMCMGWAKGIDNDGASVYWHNGGTAGSAASLAVNREKCSAVIILSNIDPEKYMKQVEPFVLKLLK
ncbi:serine hydrolase domain-containing protein [Mucilaginibacter sp. McL0603]|uniref:serine hydrolase domain-containing protein n=1 Tax=Mucilaginibacter sp. McL0603 TaxID=3415670 RepID=UPI003CEA3ED2